jgi:hypothetical protein
VALPVTCLPANNRIHKRPYGSTTGQLVPLRARCTVTLTINSLQLFCPFAESIRHSSPLCFIKSCFYALAGCNDTTLFLPSSLPILLYSLRLEPCPQGPRHLRMALPTVRIHLGEILPRTCNLHSHTALAPRLPRGVHFRRQRHLQFLLQLFSERSPTGSLRDLRSSTLPRPLPPSHRFNVLILPHRAMNREIDSSTSTSSTAEGFYLSYSTSSLFFFSFQRRRRPPGMGEVRSPGWKHILWPHGQPPASHSRRRHSASDQGMPRTAVIIDLLHFERA